MHWDREQGRKVTFFYSPGCVPPFLTGCPWGTQRSYLGESCSVPCGTVPRCSRQVLFTRSVNFPTNSGLSCCWGGKTGSPSSLLSGLPSWVGPQSPSQMLFNPQEMACIFAVAHGRRVCNLPCLSLSFVVLFKSVCSYLIRI